MPSDRGLDVETSYPSLPLDWRLQGPRVHPYHIAQPDAAKAVGSVTAPLFLPNDGDGTARSTAGLTRRSPALRSSRRSKAAISSAQRRRIKLFGNAGSPSVTSQSFEQTSWSEGLM
jgi:hypothetical protein